MNFRLAKLNNTIFNGRSVATAVKVNLVRNDTSCPISFIKLLLNSDKEEISLSAEDNTDLYDKSCTFVDSEPNDLGKDIYMLDNMSYNFKDIRCGGRSAFFNAFWDKNFKFYSVTNNLDGAPEDQDLSNDILGKDPQFKFNYASIKRHFEQKLVIPENVITLIIVYPNTLTIPLVFGYSTSKPDVNLIFNDKNDQLIYSSFEEKFGFYDEIKAFTKTNFIGLDTDFRKVNYIMDSLRYENIAGDENDELYYKYFSSNIVGRFSKEGSDAKYYLFHDSDPGKLYLLYDQLSEYNTDQHKFLLDLLNSKEISDTKEISKVKNIIFYLISDNFFSESMFSINMKIYSDKYNKNLNNSVYHIYEKDILRDIDRVVTLFEDKFIMIREFAKRCADYKVTLFMAKPEGGYHMITGTDVRFSSDDDLNGTIVHYLGNFGTKFGFECYVRNYENESEEVKTETIDYHSNDVENLFIRKRYDFQHKKSIDSIEKFDSIIYNIDKPDEIIIRNYLGLPVNYKYITTRI